MATYYQPSGKSSAAGIPILLIGGLIAAAILGAVYAYATHFIPFIYISFLLTIGLAFAMGWVINQLTKIGKIRNPSAVLWVSVVLGIAAIYFGWAVWFQAALGVLLLNPADLLAGQQLLGMTGAWSIGDWAPTGMVLYAFWIVEALIVILGTLMFSQNQVQEPFCEACDKWLEPKKEVSNLSLHEAPAELVKSLELGSIEELFKLTTSDETAYTKVTLKDCLSCEVTTLMDLVAVSTVLDKEGKATEEASFLMRNFVLSPENFNKIEAHVWDSPAEV